MTSRVPTSSGYWYGTDDAAGPGPVQVLEALRAYRTTETAMRRRTKDSMGMGEKDVLALRYLLEAHRAGTPMSPRDLAARLGISSASTTTLLDRLTRTGHVARRPHPTDRRALVIVATAEADCEVRTTLGRMHERMLAAARALDPDQAATVTAFLHAMAAAVDAAEDVGGPEGPEDLGDPAVIVAVHGTDAVDTGEELGGSGVARGAGAVRVSRAAERPGAPDAAGP
ncbi:MarR family winged helix-turn-helix transcriptional regulator [Kocuria oceani]|uniref:MarR family winged helix-turn-helix transcriptional regulator n=1 Tax=Kocuria oceani TaxID=988827 RepID=UPI0040351EFB